MRKLIRLVSISVLTAVLLALTSQGLHAATITVSNNHDSGAGSLRAALANASNSDTINFSIAGTITLTSGQLVVNRNVTIAGPGAANLSVNGNAAGRVFRIDPDTIATISGLTITNGRAPLISLDDLHGGGILNDRGTLTIANCVISGNTSVYGRGDGVYNQGPATMTIISSTITGNIGSGGASVYNQSPVAGNGVASMAIVSSTISGNGGGGVANDGSGGIVGTDMGAPSAAMTVTNSTVSGNTGPGIWQGGGFHFTRNGTRYTGSATMTVTNSTISGNASYCGLGSSIANIAANGITSTVTIGNSILQGGGMDDGFNAGNLSLVGYDGATATITSLGYNLSSDSAVNREFADPGPTPTPTPTPDTGTGPGGLLNAPGDVRNTNPLLGALQNNGGPTFTHALLPGSPAIGAGGSSIVTGFDQRGAGFPRVSGGRIDIGAFEVQSSICPQPQGYWKNNPDAWPVISNLMIGGRMYTKAELLAILRTPVGTGKNADASLILAYQLIATKLNGASGAEAAPVSSTIVAADTLLATYSGALPYRVKVSSAAGQLMVGYGSTLDSFNKGTTTAGCAL